MSAISMGRERCACGADDCVYCHPECRGRWAVCPGCGCYRYHGPGVLLCSACSEDLTAHTCRGCGEPSPAGIDEEGNCPSCAATDERPCFCCGDEARPDSRYCPRCGQEPSEARTCSCGEECPPYTREALAAWDARYDAAPCEGRR